MKEVIWFKTIVPFEIGGATDDRWSKRMQDNWMSKTTVREDADGNLWLVWAGGGKAAQGEHKIPKHNVAQISYAVDEFLHPPIEAAPVKPAAKAVAK